MTWIQDIYFLSPFYSHSITQEPAPKAKSKAKAKAAAVAPTDPADPVTPAAAS